MKLFLGMWLILAAALGNAQLGMGSSMFDMTYRPFAVMQRKEIRQELKLSKDQNKQIDDVIKAFNKEAQVANYSVEGTAMFGKMDETDKALVAVLDEGQKQRLFEMRIQMRGATALSDSEVASKLELTEDQSAGVKKLRAESMSKFLKEVQGGKRQGLDKLMEAISKQEEKDLLALLTDAQRESFTKMAGKPFKDARMKGTWPI